jgi:ubiquinone/menaquinone biosynthesis C-methylase UbiE
MNRQVKALARELKKPDKNRDAYLGYYTERDLSVLLKYLPKRCSILDVGGGYGRLAIPLAKKGYSVTVLDPIKEFLEIAESRAKKERVRIKTVIGKAEKLPFADRSFDAVLAMRDVLNYCQDHRKAVKELVRVCRKGGVIAVSCGAGKTGAKRHRTGEGFSTRVFSVAELKRLFKSQKILEVTGDSIVMPLLRKNTYNALKKTRKQILEIDKELAKEENLNFFDHIILVARKV